MDVPLWNYDSGNPERTWVRRILTFVSLFLHRAAHVVPIFPLVGLKWFIFLFKSDLSFLFYCNPWLWAPWFLAGWGAAGAHDVDVTEVKTVHFPSKPEEVLICWVKALLEGRGQSVIGPLHEYEIATTIMSIYTLSATSRLRRSWCFLSWRETVIAKLGIISRIWMIIAQLCRFPVMIQSF